MAVVVISNESSDTSIKIKFVKLKELNLYNAKTVPPKKGIMLAAFVWISTYLKKLFTFMHSHYLHL